MEHSVLIRCSGLRLKIRYLITLAAARLAKVELQQCPHSLWQHQKKDNHFASDYRTVAKMIIMMMMSVRKTLQLHVWLDTWRFIRLHALFKHKCVFFLTVIEHFICLANRRYCCDANAGIVYIFKALY